MTNDRCRLLCALPHDSQDLYTSPTRLNSQGNEKPLKDRTPYDYFSLMFPMAFLNEIVETTIANEGPGDLGFYDMLQFVGVLLAQCLDPRPSIRAWWAEAADDDLVRPRLALLGLTLSRNRFLSIMAKLRLGSYTTEDVKENPWVKATKFVDAFNSRRRPGRSWYRVPP